MKTLLVKTPTQTSAIAISQSRTVKMLVDADAQYQLIDKQNRPIQKPKTKRVGDDLWVFDEVGEAVELVLEKYYNVHPVAYPANDLEYLADMSNPFSPTDIKLAVPTVSEMADVVSTPWYATAGTKLAMIGGAAALVVGIAKSDDGHLPNADLAPISPKPLTTAVTIHDVGTITQKILDEDIVLSGTFEVSNPNAAVQIALTINGVAHQATIQGTTWALALDGQTLAYAQGTHTITVAITATTTDQTTTATAQTAYLVDTHVDKPAISFDLIAQDDIINLAESQDPTTLIMGSVQNVNDGEILTLTIGKAVATTKIVDGKFSAFVDTVALINHKTIRATITSHDEHDNTATATFSKNVSVQTKIATPTIALDDIAGDNIINKSESKQDTITISGKVTDVPVGQNVLVACSCSTCASTDWKEIYAKVQANGEFSVNFPTIDLVRAGNNTIKTTVTVVDNAKNTATASTEKTYSVDMDAPTPTIQIDNITDDNIINQNDITQNSAVLSVVVNDLGADEMVISVVLMVNGIPYTAIKTGNLNTYTANVSMADLVKETQVIAQVTVQDRAGNVATVSHQKSYDVNLTTPQVAIKLDPIANDGIIDETERTGDSNGNIIITGRAVGDYNGQDDVVISIGNSTYPTKLNAQGIFLVAVPADILAKDSTKSLTATLNIKNRVGNTATVSDTVSYTVQSKELAITLDPITTDNLINESEVAGEVVITGKVTGVDRLPGQPVTLSIGGQKFETTTNADGVFKLPILASVLKDVPTYTIWATTTGQNNAKARADLTYKVSANVAAKIDITNIDDDFGLNVAQEESIVRIGGQFEFTGHFGMGMNHLAVRHVSVKIGDKTYYSGLKEGRFYFDVPFDELQHLNGQVLDYEFVYDPRFYQLTDFDMGRFMVGEQITTTITKQFTKPSDVVKSVNIDSPYLSKNADGDYRVAISGEPMSMISGVVSGNIKPNDVVSIDVAGVKYTAVVGMDKGFKTMVKTSDLDKDDDNLVVASLTTQDLAGNAITVQDTERFINTKRALKNFTIKKPPITEPASTDHTDPNFEMPYFVRYLSTNGMNSKAFGIDVGGYDNSEKPVIKYHFATPEDFEKLKSKNGGVQGENFAKVNTLKAYNEHMKAIVRKAYGEYAKYANVEFMEVDDAFEANTNLFSADLAGNYANSSAFAYHSGNIWWSNRYTDVQSEHNPFNYYIALHEIGHTLNMRHTHDNFKGDYLPEDGLEFSVMSYNVSMNHNMHINLGGLRMYDLAHIHRQFGVNRNARSGDDVYTFKNYNTVLSDGDRYIWDGDGVDTFDASKETQGVNVNLTPGSWIYVGDKLHRNFAIAGKKSFTIADYFGLGANDTIVYGLKKTDKTKEFNNYTQGQAFIGYGTQIENLIGSEYADTLTGNDADNHIFGGAGGDTIRGGLGNDVLDGGLGNDTLIGGVGDDTYIIDSTGDSITELAGEGVDSVFSHVDFDLNGQELENLTLIGITAKTATGNELDNVLTANNMGNTLIGKAGNDTLIGGLGADILTGGDGDDIFVFSTLLNGTMDTITDFETGDKIKLDKAVFDVDASTLTERITYNKDTKVLSYDADGEGGADAIDFAKVEGVFEVKLDNFIL
ncbi:MULTISPECIES: Ig-like domain-containing protein [Moraxella]|uniref:Serralysin n=1 Tax=Moraxella lacunata TaxID=477 RepID=A0A1B8Q1X9_MORLA|nr:MULTISPECIES: Ig-like domain-containing protein [Moraxella]MBE9579436.1 Ig-like domain-containing protein [Moraxella sp. K1664]MBE9588782.1 Ig-like domain-containing protein [Moraxella sp. K1630]MBE9596978.1 Ig-like domain-containing protein [Moraxella sp. K2450]MDI4483497.1 Ig-like domain-containing protein [Moraxella lacunata]MDI4507964.1 Ig-like domain-containing protein [Moraxella lacunata]